MMDPDSAKKLTSAIDQAWDSRPAGVTFNSMGLACKVMTGLSLENPDEWAATRDQLALDSITAIIERRIVRAMGKADMRQGWLALPEYEHIPHLIKVEGGLIDINDATLEQYRETKEEIRARIKAYDYPRRSPEKLKRDKQMLSEMSKVDRRVSPLMAGDPEMKMGAAIQIHQAAMETPRAKRNRVLASKGGVAKSRRTKNQ